MRVWGLQFIVVCFCVSGELVFAQPGATTSTAAVPRSHVERFTSQQSRAERAETEASAQLQANPNDAEALNARAYARMGLGRYLEAVEDLRRTVAINPQKADYYANLGYALWKTGKQAEAIAAERSALKLDEKHFTANYQLGRFLLLNGDPVNCSRRPATCAGRSRLIHAALKSALIC